MSKKINWRLFLIIFSLSSTVLLSWLIIRWLKFSAGQPVRHPVDRSAANSWAINQISQLANPSPSPTPTPPPPQTWVLIAGGDLMFDRHLRTKAERTGSYDLLFAPQLTDFLNSADAVLANLEGPITTQKSVSQFSQPGGPGNYTFTFSPEILPTLIKNNLTLLNLGNNHILNFGQAGLDSTINYLTTAKLAFFGQPSNQKQIVPSPTTSQTATIPSAALTSPAASPTAVVSPTLPTPPTQSNYLIWGKFGQKIAILGYNQFEPNSLAKTWQNLTEIQTINPSLIILYCHWDNEYQPTAAAATINLAHQFIDAGVDLIIGSHPHVVQNHEIYRGHTIYYSLGNFVFDQYFSLATRTGLLLKIEFTFDPASQNWQYQITEQPIEMSTSGTTDLAKTDTSPVPKNIWPTLPNPSP